MVALPAYLLITIAILAGTTSSQDVCDMRAVLSRLNDLEREVSTLQAKNARLEQMTIGNVNTLFFAEITGDTIQVSHEAIIPWDSAPINLGGHFDTVTHGYTAPADGYYQFSITVRATENASYFLLVDNERYLHIGDGHGGEDYSSASTTTTIKLDAGQLIRVEKYQEGAVHGTRPHAGKDVFTSWFTGQLLYTI